MARWTRWATIAGATAALILGTLLASPAFAADPSTFTTDQLCSTAFTGAGEAPGVTKTIDASGTVMAGQVVNVTVTQNPPDNNTKILIAGDCVRVNGVYQHDLSQSSHPANVHGPWMFSYTVPSSAKAGDKICDRAVVDARRTGSDTSAHEKSKEVCVMVAKSPSTSTATTAPASSVAGQTTSTSALPFTGSSTWPTVMVGVGLLAIGGVIALLTSDRRRRSTS